MPFGHVKRKVTNIKNHITWVSMEKLPFALINTFLSIAASARESACTHREPRLSDNMGLKK